MQSVSFSHNKPFEVHCEKVQKIYLHFCIRKLHFSHVLPKVTKWGNNLMKKFLSNVYVHKVKKKSFWNHWLYLLAIPLFSKNSKDCHKKKNVFVYFLSHFLYCWSVAVDLNNGKVFLCASVFQIRNSGNWMLINCFCDLGYQD